MNQLSSFFQKISNVGNHKGLTAYEVIRLKIYNKGAVILTFGIFISAIEICIHDLNTGLQGIIVGFCPLIGLVLNAKGKLFWSRIYLTFFLPILLSYFVVFLYSNFWGISVTFIAYVVAIFIGYNRLWLIILNIAFLLVLNVSTIYYVVERDGFNVDMFLSLHTAVVIFLSVSAIFWVTAIFITEIKKQQRSLLKNNEKLSKALSEINLKNNLLEIIAHDLRGPVLSFQQLTKKVNYLIKKEDTARLLALGNNYEKTGNHLFHNLDHLLTWVLSQKEKLNVEPTSFDLQELVEKIKKDVLILPGINTCNINNQIVEKTFITTDKNILEIILLNIIQNAVKFSFSNQEILVKNCIKDQKLQVFVIDSGQGFHPEIIDKIKNGIWQVDKNRISATGFGLGLSTCFSLIKFLKGNISIQSEKGKGTTVIIELPLYDPVVT